MKRLLVLLLVAGCYDVPKPVCGFGCGPDGACPDGYECRDDNACHLQGSEPMVCRQVDAGVDAPIDAPF